MAKNIELLKRLRTRFLRIRHKRHFDMDDVAKKTPCGAALCIAGHALQLEGYRVKFDEYGDYEWFAPNGEEVIDPLDEAQRLLGLTREEAQADKSYSAGNHKANGLFFRFDLKTPKQAAKAIEKMIAGASQ